MNPKDKECEKIREEIKELMESYKDFTEPKGSIGEAMKAMMMNLSTEN